MKKSAIVLWIFLSLLLGSGMTAQEGALSSEAKNSDYKVVVHAGNPTTSLESKTVDRIFIKKWKRWDDDELVVPVNQVVCPVREAFTRGVHKKDVSAILKYWQRMIFSGRDVPPPELANDAEVLVFVKTKRGAIGYVSATTELIDGVKELRIVEKEK
jgi:ABC-type phosphate transport system substrate-binding protein